MLKYWLWLTTRKGLGARGACVTAKHFPTPRDAYFADKAEYALIEGLRDFRPLLDKDLSEPERILRTCREKNIGILTMQDAAYPERLFNIHDAPPVLYYRGNLPDLNDPSVAVVGTRQCSPYGLMQARQMGYGLSACGCTVVSGGAKGVDGAAMVGALAGGSPVIAVLGCGVDVVYPKEHRELFDKVMSRGCLISEYPPGTEPQKYYFPARNRILSGLSLGVLVVEAPERSGALLTARFALDQGRDVFTIPANVDSISCRGNLNLLRDGAILARDAWDVLQEYIQMYPDRIVRRSCLPLVPQPSEERKAQASVVRHDLAERMELLRGDEKIVADLLCDGAKYVDILVEASRLPVGRVLAALTMLEVKKIVRRVGDRRFALVPESD